MNKEQQEKLIKITEKLDISTIKMENTNIILNSIIDNVWLHFKDIMEKDLSISYPFGLECFKKFSIIFDDKGIYIKIFDYNTIKEYINKCCGNYLYIFEGNDLSFDKLRSINSQNELKENYPEIFSIYEVILDFYRNLNIIIKNEPELLEKDPSTRLKSTILKVFNYHNNINLFINDLCDFFEILLNNKEIIENIENNNLYELKISNEDEYYNILFGILCYYLEYAQLQKSLKVEDKNVKENIIELINELNKYPGKLALYNIRSHQEEFNYEEIKKNLIEQYIIADNNYGFGDHEVLPGGGFVDVGVKSHGKEISIPLFNDQLFLTSILVYNNFYEDSLDYCLIKYSKIFEIGYDLNGEYILGLKNEYNNYSIQSLLEIAISNIKKLKEKDIDFSVTKSETQFLKDISDGLYNETLYSKLQNILSRTIKFEENAPIITNNIGNAGYLLILASMYYSKINNYKETNDLDLIIFYRNYCKDLEKKCSKFIKFADKSNLKEEDFIKLKKEIKLELENRIGIEKLDDILTKIKDMSDPEEIRTTIESLLIKKKSIKDEISIVESQKKRTLESSPEYKALNQRLNKLLLYKNHFDSEEVINGEGVFQDCYGFDFDGLYVFDFFSDIEEEDILKKANRDYGHRIYILTADDYLILKDLKNRTEVNKYIKDKLEPCADVMNHGSNDEVRLLSKVKAVKSSLKKKNYIVELSKTDNPVTDDEIIMTQEEFDYYVSKFISDDKGIIEKIRKKSKMFETKESIEREKNKKTFYEWNQDREIVSETKFDEEEKKIVESEIENINVYLVKINLDRIKNGLDPLNFDDGDYYEVMSAIINYMKDNEIKSNAKRDPQVSFITRSRTFYNGTYHCELCEDAISPYIMDVECHHFIPISKGGPDNLCNTVCLCDKCHKGIHNGLVTDYQNYKLIKTIKDFILSRTPEDLPDFERTLGFAENKYLEQLDSISFEIEQVNSQIEHAYEKDLSDEEILEEVELLEKQSKVLEINKNDILKYANRIQDYYRHSDEYLGIEEKTRPIVIR